MTSYNLIRAVRRGDVTKASAIIASFGLSHSEAWADGYILLCHALHRKHRKIAKILLKHGSRVNSETHCRRNTPLHFAVKNEDTAMVAMLLDREANVDARNNTGQTPLHLSVEKNNSKIVALLLNKNADVNAQNDSGRTPLQCAYATNRGEMFQSFGVDIVEMLIKHGANVNVIDETGKSLISYAIEKIDAKMTKLLVSGGAEIKFNPDVLHRCVNSNAKEIVKLMLDHDVDHDIMAKGTFGRTALWHVMNSLNCKKCEHYCCIQQDLAETLLSRGAQVNANNENEESFMHIAAKRGCAKMVKILLRYNADVNFADKTDMKTPLHYSVARKNAQISRTLLCAGASSNAKDTTGKTALHYACEYKYNDKTVHTLLEFGAEIDDKDSNDSTPLHVAAFNGSLKIVETLLKSFADAECTDKDGTTALRVAWKYGFSKIVKELLDYGADPNAICKKGRSLIDYTNLGLFRHNENSRESYFRFMLYNLINYNSDDNESDYHNEDHSDCDHEEYHDFFDDTFGFQSDNRDSGKTADTIKQHIIKIKSLNIRDSERNFESVELDYEFADFQEKCEREVRLMKRKKIGKTNISYYNVLIKSINQLAIVARNQDIVKDFESSRCRENFSIYYKMLLHKFKKGQKRGNLLNPSVKSFNLLSGFLLPELASKQVLDMLSNKDLENLIKAASET